MNGIKFLTERLVSEWQDNRLEPIARVITLEVALEAAVREDTNTITLTSIYRTQAEDATLGGSGIHCGWRAVDIRTIDQPPTFHEIVDAINDRWIYDPNRPELLVALDRPHGSGPHLHIQVHPNTVLRTLRQGDPDKGEAA